MKVRNNPLYSYGTWTPEVLFGVGAVNLTYNYRAGNWTRVGNMVIANFYLALTNKGTSNGNFSIHGLPFLATVGRFPVVFTYAQIIGAVLAGQFTMFGQGPGDMYIYMYQTNLATGIRTYITDAQFANTSEVFGTVIYYA